MGQRAGNTVSCVPSKSAVTDRMSGLDSKEEGGSDQGRRRRARTRRRQAGG